MAQPEIHLNRKGINSIETPPSADVQPGTDLEILLVNEGHPLHVSFTAINASRFTPFLHQNLFVQGEEILEIPVKRDAPQGSFDLEVVTGYGRTKATFRVTVVPAPPPQTLEPMAAPPPPVWKVPDLRRAAPFLIAGGVLVYIAWWIAGKPDLLSLLAVLALLAGALLAWRQPPSS